MVGIARKAKRARASIYRRWPSKPYLVADCLVRAMGASPAPDTGALRRDLRAAVGTLQRAFSGPLRQALPGLVADMAHDPELARAVRRQVLVPRRQSMREALERARARGETRRTMDIELRRAFLFPHAVRTWARRSPPHPGRRRSCAEDRRGEVTRSGRQNARRGPISPCLPPLVYVRSNATRMPRRGGSLTPARRQTLSAFHHPPGPREATVGAPDPSAAAARCARHWCRSPEPMAAERATFRHDCPTALP